MTDYTPIDCGVHSQYELAIMRARKITLSWCDTDWSKHTEAVTPTDLLTRNHEEFLVVLDGQGLVHEIRLDRIRHVPLDDN